MKIRDMLKIMGFESKDLVTVGPDEFVSAVIQKLAKHNKGALPVCNDKDELIGIITERDIVRKCFVREGDFINKKIRDIMTKQVAIAIMDDELDYAIHTMKQKKIRHIPIVDEKKVVGIISMRDVIGFQYEEAKAEIRYVRLLPKRSTFK